MNKNGKFRFICFLIYLIILINGMRKRSISIPMRSDACAFSFFPAFSVYVGKSIIFNAVDNDGSVEDI